MFKPVPSWLPQNDLCKSFHVLLDIKEPSKEQPVVQRDLPQVDREPAVFTFRRSGFPAAEELRELIVLNYVIIAIEEMAKTIAKRHYQLTIRESDRDLLPRIIAIFIEKGYTIEHRETLTEVYIKW